MKLKKASLLTKLVILTLLIGTATGLLTMRSQLQAAQADLAAAQKQVEEQKQVNADLARSKLGLVEPGEYVFQFTD